MKPDYALPPYARIIWAFLNIALGLVPALAFFIWIERNTALPGMQLWPLELQWPWFTLSSSSLWIQCGWNTLLILGFGALHSGFAQVSVTTILTKHFPPQTIRTLYLIITGVAVTAVMGLWQHTGIILWNLRLWNWGSQFSIVLSLLLYWGLMLMSAKLISGFDTFQFLGLRQLYSYARDAQSTIGNQKLVTQGFYGLVRHPVYTFTLCAFLITPMMSLDRMTILAASLMYLMIGIPIEEKKLFTTFGEDYKRYQSQVPALFPNRWPK